MATGAGTVHPHPAQPLPSNPDFQSRHAGIANLVDRLTDLELMHADARVRIREGIASGCVGLNMDVEIDAQFKARVAFLIKAMKEIGKTLSGESEGFFQRYGI
jgi:hypothetical protein